MSATVIGVGPKLCGLPRTTVPYSWVNKGK
jgi:hypothetical protein